MRYFFDSSALAKRYHPELGTPKVLSIFAEPGREIRISKLSFIEIQSVFAMKVRSGVIGRDDAGVQRARLIAEIAAGEIEVCAVTANLFDDAAKLIGRHSFSHRLRTLDALQLAPPQKQKVKERTESRKRTHVDICIYRSRQSAKILRTPPRC